MTTMFVLQADPWSNLLERLGDLARGAGQGALYVAVGLVVMLAGWGLASTLARLVRVLLRALRFNGAMRRLMGPRVTLRHEPAAIAAWAVYWLVIAGAVMLVLETMGFGLAASVAERLGEVVPRIVTSALLLAVGALVALLGGGVTRHFLESADIRAAKLQGRIVTSVLTGFAVLLALDQLGFAAQFVMSIGVVAVAAAGLGLALAFGLGCRDLARDFLVEYLRSLDDEGPKRPL